jgi:hypothetical protein
MFKEPGAPAQKKPAYNPFAESLKPKPKPPAELGESSRRIADFIDEELAKPTEETTMRLGSASELEKTMRHPGMEAARKPVEEEEILEGELVEDGEPELEGFQSGAELTQEKLRAVQAKAEGAEFGLDSIDPRNAASLKEGTRRVVDSFLGSPEDQKALEIQLGLGTGKLTLERTRLETLIKDKVAAAAFALRGKVKPAFKVVDELRQDIANLARRL